MPPIHKTNYINITMKTKWNQGKLYTWLTTKELEQLFKKIGKIVGRGKNYCPCCKAGLK